VTITANDDPVAWYFLIITFVVFLAVSVILSAIYIRHNGETASARFLFGDGSDITLSAAAVKALPAVTFEVGQEYQLVVFSCLF
jgi:hypothetical protein